MKAVPELVQHLRDEMSKVVVGQDELQQINVSSHCCAAGTFCSKAFRALRRR